MPVTIIVNTVPVTVPDGLTVQETLDILNDPRAIKHFANPPKPEQPKPDFEAEKAKLDVKTQSRKSYLEGLMEGVGLVKKRLGIEPDPNAPKTTADTVRG